jgi:hypothetical protein
MSLKISKKDILQLPRESEVSHQFDSETKLHLHFYNPIGDGDWYVIAGESKGKDWTFFGVIVFDNARLGRFTLRELKKKRLPFGFRIQLDKNFKPQTWHEVRTAKTS